MVLSVPLACSHHHLPVPTLDWCGCPANAASQWTATKGQYHHSCCHGKQRRRLMVPYTRVRTCWGMSCGRGGMDGTITRDINTYQVRDWFTSSTLYGKKRCIYGTGSKGSCMPKHIGGFLYFVQMLKVSFKNFKKVQSIFKCFLHINSF